ncbi:hypothetical protein PIB30_046987 [Stylosanthes scabra]|uniref:Uncharacterized protein n=1 Tax=Stylosanthes scabra TaxID=79078 RepID=A0ABU6VI36_9FABA|nr:hypothetical protein [Stylosanthes scabra]
MLFVGEAKYRRDNKPLAVRGSSFREEVYASLRLVVGIDTDVVNGSEMDSVADLVMLERSEYGKEADQSAELIEINRHGDKEKEGEIMFLDEIWNEGNCGKNKSLAFFNSEVDKESDRSESKSSDRTVTWDYERKESDKNKVILREVVVESKGAMEESGSLAANESMCSSGVGIFEAVNEGFYNKQPDSKDKEEGANPMEMVSKSHMGVQRPIPVVEIGPVVSNEEEDIMSILKEMNEARALKRREAKKKEKARKSRPKKLKL